MLFPFAALSLALLLAVAALLRGRSRRAALAAISAMMVVFPLLASAPDVALVGGLLFSALLVLGPAETAGAPLLPIDKPALALSLVFAALFTWTVHTVLALPLENQTEYFVGQSYFTAGGRNLVEMIHADFRSLDALLAVAVLTALWVKRR
jgi:multicomponent Na+:H+ antiporter subunit A